MGCAGLAALKYRTASRMGVRYRSAMGRARGNFMAQLPPGGCDMCR
jgi:hypothetical protein